MPDEGRRLTLSYAARRQNEVLAKLQPCHTSFVRVSIFASFVRPSFNNYLHRPSEIQHLHFASFVRLTYNVCIIRPSEIQHLHRSSVQDSTFASFVRVSIFASFVRPSFNNYLHRPSEIQHLHFASFVRLTYNVCIIRPSEIQHLHRPSCYVRMFVYFIYHITASVM